MKLHRYPAERYPDYELSEPGELWDEANVDAPEGLYARYKRALAESGLLKILEEHAGEFGDGIFQIKDYPEIVTFVRLMEKTNENDFRSN